jgi:hypothetical protein
MDGDDIAYLYSYGSEFLCIQAASPLVEYGMRSLGLGRFGRHGPIV